MVDCEDMGNGFDISLERLTGGGMLGLGKRTVSEGGSYEGQEGETDLKIGPYKGEEVLAGTKPAAYRSQTPREREESPNSTAINRCTKTGPGGGTFYLETFGCQMNEHDSEKVAGVLLARGYKQVERTDEASVILYNTCSIREKAAQKVFSRLGEYRTTRKEGQMIGVLGCVAQQEGEKIFERAPWVSLVCGSASYRQLPELLAQLEAGGRWIMGLDLDTEETFE